MPQIQINSILGGHAPTTNFAGDGQFRASLGIDPAQPIDDNDTAYSTIASGVIRPTACEKFSSTTITSAPLWIRSNPKNALVYVYDANGSAYTIDPTMTTVTALADRGLLTNSLGNGCEYYDNYMYFFKNTDVLRYGPLNGTPSFGTDANASYWVSTLGKVALQNTTYPTTFKNQIRIPNHPACRHSDGALYFGDVVGNVGTIHFIKTKYTTVEGDTNDGSTYNALDVGYGLYPTAIESYGTDLAIAFYEGSAGNLRQPRGKIAFWDTTSASPTKIVWVEFPDTLITAMKNVNGILYVVSGNVNNQGFRVTQFMGGYQFQEVFYSETGEPCLQGAIDGILNRVIIGSHTSVPESSGCVYATGLQKSALGTGMFNIMGCTGQTSSTCVTSLLYADNSEFGFYTPITGWTQAGEGSTGVSHGLDKQDSLYNYAPSVWWSQMYRVGKHFKVTKLRIPLCQAVTTNMAVVPKIYTDDGNGTTYTLTTINNTNYPNSERYITYNLENVSARNNFWLELRFSGSNLLTVGLPITIDIELTDE